MHEECPGCGVSFEREPGFFYGALYFSYGIGILLAAPLSIYLFVQKVDEVVIYFVAIAQLALISPLLFRYSRVAWMHFDQRIDPR
jgi:hypothetical protein